MNRFLHRSLSFTLIMSLILLLTSCVAREKQDSVYSTTEPEVNAPMPLPEYPVIDGSTSTIVMHAAIQAYLTDEYYYPVHSQTYGALERLVPGHADPADAVLAVKYYDETLQDVKEQGADLVITPIAKEGFVFILHEDNPVDSLTPQQIKDIYLGKITNWSEVGGLDEDIKLFTRNMDSGSQTAMEAFMDGAELPAGEAAVGSMGDLLAAVMMAGSSAVGYNIYSWSMGQNLEEMGLKTVKVDDIAASNETLADNSYPLLVYTYSYYDRSNIKGKALTDWLLTEEGQKVIISAGYVGIHGGIPSGEPVDFGKDEYDAFDIVRSYYGQNGWNPDGVALLERIFDQEQVKELSLGKEKDITALWVCSCLTGSGTQSEQVFRYIVLTRERGGVFEVINEGEVLEYQDGGITVAQSKIE